MNLSAFRFVSSGVLSLAVMMLAGCNRSDDSDFPIVLPRPTMPPNAIPVAPSTLAKWPWPNARTDTPHRGVTHWQARQPDGTSLDLLRFDFNANPALRFELYAQDEDDKKPFDNIVAYWPMGVGQATKHLNQKFAKSKSGTVVAAWNGPFFGYHRGSKNPPKSTLYSGETAFHVSPVVLRGKVFHNVANHRWTFGVKYSGTKPTFKVFHLPGRKLLEQEFDFASGSVQCLIKAGKALKFEPFPKPDEAFKEQPVPSTPAEVGHIPFFDHAKFSRASIGWSKDSSQLFMLLVRESSADNEGNSIRGFMHGEAQSNGWTVLDLQNFWLALHKIGWVQNAINSDGGGLAQMTYLLPTSNYSLISPGGGDVTKWERKTFSPDFKDAPEDGSIMYFYVRDSAARPTS